MVDHPSYLGPYRVVREIGRGGMGVVYRGYEESLDRHVALKVLGPELLAHGDFLERFRREAMNAARLNHPNIVQIYRIETDTQPAYFAMEYVEGENLQEICARRCRIGVSEAAEWMIQAARGLARAHEMGIVHRDIKPANLILDQHGVIKIADFGVARSLHMADKLTATGAFVGTPQYLAPEQCLGEVADARSDIYSLGVTFYELVTGRAPFDAETPLALLRIICDAELPDPQSLVPDLDPSCRALLLKMLAKDKAHRPPDCAALILELEALIRAPAQGEGGTLPAGLGPAHAPSRAAFESPKLVAAAEAGRSAASSGAATTGSVGAAVGSKPQPASSVPMQTAPVAAGADAGPAGAGRNNSSPLILVALAAGMALLGAGLLVNAWDRGPSEQTPATQPAGEAPLAAITAQPSQPSSAATRPDIATVVAAGSPAPSPQPGDVVGRAHEPAEAAPAKVSAGHASAARPPEAAPAAKAHDELEPEQVPAKAQAEPEAAKTQTPRAVPKAAPVRRARAVAPSKAVAAAPAAKTRAVAHPSPPPPQAVPAPPPVEDPARQGVLAGIRSANAKIRRAAAKLAYRNHRRDPVVLEEIERVLLANFARIPTGVHSDSMAWLCRVLGVSGNPKYKATLEKVARGAPKRRLRAHALKAASML